MFNYDDVNFECRRCGEVKYRQDADRIAYLMRENGGLGRPPCPVCGRVSIPINGGFSCLHCSSYYEMPNANRPPTLLLMPRRKDCVPVYMVLAMVMLAGNLVVSGAIFFGG